MKYYIMRFYDELHNDVTGETMVLTACDCFTESDYRVWLRKPFKMTSMGQNYTDCYDVFDTNEDFMDTGLVSMSPATEEFYALFHLAVLSETSICDIFSN